MGLVRFLLALSVVFVHLGWFVPNALHGYTILPGIVAVQAFFIISGFYMSLILNEKYIKTKRPYRMFITNRFLRIYPIYWFILILTFCFQLFTIGPSTMFASIAIQQSPITIFNNLQHIIKNITIIVTPDPFIWIKEIYSGILIPQSWTLILEVIFYIIAPFIVRRSMKILLFFLIAALGVRYLIWHLNIYPTYNSDYFFLPNFVFFILGIFSYKLKVLLKYVNLSGVMYASLFIFFILFTLLYSFIPDLHHIKVWMYYFTLTGMIPLLINFDSTLKMKLLGDISYPLYISHFFVLSVVSTYLIKSVFFELFSVITFSFLIHYFIARPIDMHRSNRYKRNISEDIE